MSSEVLCQFPLGNNEGIFERPRKIVWTKMFFVHTHDSNPKPNVETLVELLLIYQLVELNSLYKIHYFTFFLPFKKVPSFSFFSMTLILRKAPF